MAFEKHRAVFVFFSERAGSEFSEPLPCFLSPHEESVFPLLKYNTAERCQTNRVQVRKLLLPPLRSVLPLGFCSKAVERAVVYFLFNLVCTVSLVNHSASLGTGY